jgi:hypothetical protein
MLGAGGGADCGAVVRTDNNAVVNGWRGRVSIGLHSEFGLGSFGKRHKLHPEKGRGAYRTFGYLDWIFGIDLERSVRGSKAG